MTFYRQPERSLARALGLVGRIAMWLGIACLVVATGTAGGAYLYFHESVAAVAAKTPEVSAGGAAARRRRSRASRPSRSSSATTTARATGTDAPWRSDTLMLVRADPATDSISLLSFPRDMRVEIRCPGRTPYFDKINAAYANCGPQGSLQTVQGAHRASRSTTSSRSTSAASARSSIGSTARGSTSTGATSTIAAARPATRRSTCGPGYQQLTGRQTLDYVRYRHTDSDLYRVARQQQFVKAFKGQVQESFAPIALPKVVNAITNNVEVAQGGGVDVDGRTVLSYALFAYGLPRGPRLPDADRGARGLHRADDRLGEHHAGDRRRSRIPTSSRPRRRPRSPSARS